jgi:hypothetical protein
MSNEHTPLVGGQDLCDRFVNRRQQLALLGLGIRLKVGACEHAPTFGITRANGLPPFSSVER